MSKRICVWGDSIAHGSCDNIGGGWVDRLKIFFNQSEHDYSVYNLGVSGDNSSDLLKRFEIEYNARQSDVVIIAIGINDSQYNINTNKNRLELNKYENNIKKIIDIIELKSKKILFLGMSKVIEVMLTPIPWDENMEKCYSNKEIQKYISILKNIASTQKCNYLDIFELLKNEDMEDGLHPNASGHKKIFEQVKNYLIDNKIV